MSSTNIVSATLDTSDALHLQVFSPVLRTLWMVLVIITVGSEMIPISLMPPLPFYCYCITKLSAFVCLGYVAPLAFCRFNALNRGILLATLSATCVEVLQGILHHGHSFHWYELIVKLTLILLGFALALEARYERTISVGPIHVRLIGE
jgi:hypothetical protein